MSLTIHGEKTTKAVLNRDEFDAGNYSGGRKTGWTGILPNIWKEHYQARADRISYVVYSYATPIGWYDIDFGWFVPVHSYSNSTNRHQSALRAALKGYFRASAMSDLPRIEQPVHTLPVAALRTAARVFDVTFADTDVPLADGDDAAVMSHYLMNH